MATKSKETNESPADFAKKIWLAGLGAYGRAYDEAVARYERATRETPKLFKDLVKKGEELETDTRTRFDSSDMRKSAATLEDRLRKVRESLGFGFGFAGADDVERLERKVDQLTRKVDALAKAVQPKAKAVQSKAKPAAKRKKAPASRPRSKATKK